MAFAGTQVSGSDRLDGIDGDKLHLIDGDPSLSPDGAAGGQHLEIAPLQLESHNTQNRSTTPRQEGLKAIIISCICFAISVTVALILTIYLAPPPVAKHGGVSSDVKMCSDLGVELLKKGGSAVDAAVATVICNGLVNPQHSGLGGGGLMIIHDQKKQNTVVVDFMHSIQNEASDIIGMSSTVAIPGLLKGLELAHDKFGKLSWKEVVMSVVSVTSPGVNITADFKSSLSLTSYSEVKNYYNSLITTDNKLDVSQLGRLLQDVAEHGTQVFYNGSVANDIHNAVTKIGGRITLLDLLEYRAIETKPITTSFFDMSIETVPVPGGGPILLLMTNIIENLTRNGIISWNSTDLYHYIVEAMKFAYAHQSELLDLDSNVENITETIISKSYASQLAGQISKASTNLDSKFYLPTYTSVPPMKGTSHVSVIGPNDDLVSVTTSLGSSFGSGLITAKYGIVLNDLLQSTIENTNDMRGRNKRQLVAMTPSIVYNSVRPCGKRIALGGAHGISLISGICEVLINMIGKQMNLSESISEPRVYDPLQPDAIYYDNNLSPAVIEMLKKKGHTNFTSRDNGLNIVYGVVKVNETVYAGSDPRTNIDSAAVY